MSYAGSNVQAFLEALTAEMVSAGFRVPHLLGAKLDAEFSNVERITWLPKSRASAPPHEQPTEGQAVKQKTIRFDVVVYGRDFASLDRLADGLEVALYDLFSDNGAKVAAAQSPIREPNVAASMYSVTLSVDVMIPVCREFWTVGVATPVTATLEVTNPQGESPETVLQ